MRKFLLSAVSAVALATTAYAEEYVASTWLEPSHILTKDAYVPYLADIKEATGGGVDFELFTSSSLLPPTTTLSGVGDGVAQLGLVAASYTPSELPLSGMINDLAFVATDPMAAAIAFTELAIFDQRLIDEYAKHNTLTLGAYSTPLYLFACMIDVLSTDDVRGKKIRTNGRAQNEWISSLGGVPVVVPSTEIYSGLERGAIDCTLGDATNLENGPKFGEVTKALTMMELGTAMGISYVYNRDFWREIGPEARRQIIDVTAQAIARKQVAYEGAVGDALQKTRARGTRINEPHQSLVDSVAAFRTTVIETYPKRTMEERGIADPSDMAREFVRLQDKWIGLLGAIDRTDVDAVAAVINAEIFSKIDENSYGL